MKWSGFALVAILFGHASIAAAYWDVQNSGEDVFGNVNVTAFSIGDNGNTIRFECGSSSDPFLVFLLRDNSGDIPQLPAEFVHVDQNGVRHVTDAELVPWNETYVAVRVNDPVALTQIVEHMLVATDGLSVGVEIPLLEIRVGDTFSSQGSTAAGRILEEHCLEK